MMVVVTLTHSFQGKNVVVISDDTDVLVFVSAPECRDFVLALVRRRRRPH